MTRKHEEEILEYLFDVLVILAAGIIVYKGFPAWGPAGCVAVALGIRLWWRLKS